tara:strand:+ start:639 stop:1451 length:813 start_codon:yes stop_codon:yes gene_type:complete
MNRFSVQDVHDLFDALLPFCQHTEHEKNVPFYKNLTFYKNVKKQNKNKRKIKKLKNKVKKLKNKVKKLKNKINNLKQKEGIVLEINDKDTNKTKIPNMLNIPVSKKNETIVISDDESDSVSIESLGATINKCNVPNSHCNVTNKQNGTMEPVEHEDDDNEVSEPDEDDEDDEDVASEPDEDEASEPDEDEVSEDAQEDVEEETEKKVVSLEEKSAECKEDYDEEEVFDIEINKTKYYVTNSKNSIIYEYLEDGDIGEEMGNMVDGKITWY